jgi:hypothetical protein
MATTHIPDQTATAYTAMLGDGPLEGKTVRTAFGEDGRPQARLEIRSGTGSKRYVYLRSGGAEFDESSHERPSAVEYRYQRLLVD